MDDVDAVQAQIARNMLASGDWVTARLDGVAYLEKAPLVYWAMGASYKIFGVHDWSARIPIVLAAVALAIVVALFGRWAFGERAGIHAGLCIGSCTGLFLFTRILIPDVMLTLVLTLAMWALLRALDEDEPNSKRWAFVMACCVGVGLLLKSLIAVVFPGAIAILFLAITRQLFLRESWNRLCVSTGIATVAIIALPWHVLAAIRNPPLFAFTLRSSPGQYHGFTWFYFVNEQLLRFLNLRYPRDYDTVPRVLFWSLLLVWLFPWSAYLPAAAKLSYKPIDRAGRVRLLALCWFVVVMVFFTFSTTQEYYAMPCFPALALLIGAALASDGPWVQAGTRVLSVICAFAAAVAFGLCWHVRALPAPGDISSALSRNPDAYRLSMGHMLDLTIGSFAYLRAPLLLAGTAFLTGALWTFRAGVLKSSLAIAVMMVLFFQAARNAMVVFDPYLSSRPIATALQESPGGQLILNGQYYDFSSVIFYTNRDALILNGKKQNLEYGAYAPSAPAVFIGDLDFKSLWNTDVRCYVVTAEGDVTHLRLLVNPASLIEVARSGGKLLLTNHALKTAHSD